MQSLTFKARIDVVDSLIESAARRRNANVDSLERALNDPAIPFVQLFPAPEPSPAHFGAIAKSLWTLTDEMFKPADFPEDCPPGFSAKSVQIADIYEAPITTTVRTVFLTLWADQAFPVMVPCPEIPNELLDPPGDAKLSLTRELLCTYVQEICDRLNVIAPAALLLGTSTRDL